MKVEVVRRYKDKYTKVIHEVGEEIDVTDKRFEEINSTAYGIFVKEIKTDFNKMTKAELIKYAKDVELNMGMTKAEMIELLKK